MEDICYGLYNKNRFVNILFNDLSHLANLSGNLNNPVQNKLYIHLLSRTGTEAGYPFKNIFKRFSTDFI